MVSSTVRKGQTLSPIELKCPNCGKTIPTDSLGQPTGEHYELSQVDVSNDTWSKIEFHSLKCLAEWATVQVKLGHK